MYRGEQNQDQIEKDVKNALASVKVIPSRCIIKPYMKVPLKIHFKPVGLISSLNVQVSPVTVLQYRFMFTTHKHVKVN